MIYNILKKKRLDEKEVVNTIHDNIHQQRSDLKICLPELKGILFGLMEEHFQDIKFLPGKLGEHHPKIIMLEQSQSMRQYT